MKIPETEQKVLIFRQKVGWIHRRGAKVAEKDLSGFQNLTGLVINRFAKPAPAPGDPF